MDQPFRTALKTSLIFFTLIIIKKKKRETLNRKLRYQMEYQYMNRKKNHQ